MKILFVCLGNICRSPMAEFVMKDMVRKAELAGNFEVASAATSREERNLRDMQRICGGDPEKKMHLLMEFAGQKKDIADPWYTGDFETTWQQVERGCRGLLGYCTGQTQE